MEILLNGGQMDSGANENEATPGDLVANVDPSIPEPPAEAVMFKYQTHSTL